MTKFNLVVYIGFAYLPLISIIISIIFFIAGAILKYKKRSIYKKTLITGGIFLAIFILCLMAVMTMGFIGVGPGMSE